MFLVSPKHNFSNSVTIIWHSCKLIFSRELPAFVPLFEVRADLGQLSSGNCLPCPPVWCESWLLTAVSRELPALHHCLRWAVSRELPALSPCLMWGLASDSCLQGVACLVPLSELRSGLVQLSPGNYLPCPLVWCEGWLLTAVSRELPALSPCMRQGLAHGSCLCGAACLVPLSEVMADSGQLSPESCLLFPPLWGEG